MQIPDYRKTAVDQHDTVLSSKPLPSLAAVTFHPSLQLLRFYRCAYVTFALALLMVFYPFIREEFTWVCALALLLWGLWKSYRHSLAREPKGTLEFSGERWMYKPIENDAIPLQLTGEVLCWSWVIILPLREPERGKHYRLPIFRDALTASDNARLRRWLQACLIPKG